MESRCILDALNPGAIVKGKTFFVFKRPNSSNQVERIKLERILAARACRGHFPTVLEAILCDFAQIWRSVGPPKGGQSNIYICAPPISR